MRLRRPWPFVEREHDHDWFPGLGQREFITSEDICLGCRATRVILPWGECITGHPVHEHYDSEGQLQPVARCPQGPL